MSDETAMAGAAIKTQANEPSFVLVPRVPTDAMIEAMAGNISTGIQCMGVNIGAMYAAALAAAPPVPSPAHGGARALEDFLQDARSWLDSRVDNARPGWMVAKIEAAEAALSSLSPVAVKEADAKAGKVVCYVLTREGVPQFHRVFKERDHAEREAKANDEAGQWMIQKEGGSPVLALGVIAPSTPSPQIGKAGAGPGCICQGCDRTYTGDLHVPDDVWERVKPTRKAEGGRPSLRFLHRRPGRGRRHLDLRQSHGRRRRSRAGGPRL